MKAGTTGVSALTEAAANGHEKCVEILLEAGVNIHADPTENPLLTAVLHNRVNCVRVLIEAGASVNKGNYARTTSIILAAERGYDKCLEMLLQAGGNVNFLDDNENAAIFYAAKGVHVLCASYLIKAGADVNISDFVGKTPISKLISVGNQRAVDLLITQGADVNQADVNCKTPLMKATESEPTTTLAKVHMITSLLRAGAYVNKTDIRGNNTLKAYLLRCHPADETVCLLLHAAGEDIVDSFHRQSPEILQHVEVYPKIPEFLQHGGVQIHLKHICRGAIRKHLLKLDPHQHLFRRIPQLGLPSALTRYLLFNMSLETSAADDEDGK